ncbi:MAG: UDP-N-acetylmuramoyl-L-alanine--D-glutamate ligase, partial [Pseudomonadales bacterium]|nr:UDP-N-acetylmuramoyl-L-alanine--D-glutamate ligase [Pseudomonadales bacterium]
GQIVRYHGFARGVGGNTGTPGLELMEKGCELFVLEVSSYQLETANPLPCELAVLLNLSPDHLDRYDSVEAYYRTKAEIYANCRKAVINRELDFPLDISAPLVYSFGLTEPSGEFELGIEASDEDQWLARGNERLMKARDLKIKGRHNQANALAALAVGYAMEFDEATMLETLRTFKGLEHRCEYLGVRAGMEWFNDSKSTNTGSTLAAMEGLSTGDKNMILILGGIDKGADFSVMASSVNRYVKLLLVFGRDASRITARLEGSAPTFYCDDLVDVIGRAIEFGDEGDQVLFSPGCSSFDMFDNFEHRGRMFKTLLEEKVS